MRITLPWQTRSQPRSDGKRRRLTVEAALTSPLARAIAATFGFFLIRSGANAHHGPTAVVALVAGAFLFWFCVVGRLPLRRHN